MSDNNLYFVGNATREPELKFVGTGTALTKFGLAVNRKWKQGDEWKEEVTFIDVTVWGQLAEHVAQSVKKGDRIMVAGRLDMNNYETKEGEKRTGYQVTADEVCLSLKYATGTSTRAERQGSTNRATNNDGFNQDNGNEQPF